MVLKVENVHTHYRQSHVLQGVSLEVAVGQIVAIVGRNGVGKTTLIRSIIGFTPVTRGSIYFRNTRISGKSPYEIARLGIGLVPQGRRVFASLNIREHLELAYRPRGRGMWTVETILGRFPQLKAIQFARAGKLSGGEQQMLASGRALAGNPSLILMDEPTEGLAPIRVHELRRLLAGLRQQGTAILLVEQNLPFVLKLADIVHVLDKGVFVHDSTPVDLLRNPTVMQRHLHLR